MTLSVSDSMSEPSSSDGWESGAITELRSGERGPGDAGAPFKSAILLPLYRPSSFQRESDRVERAKPMYLWTLVNGDRSEI